MKISNQTFIMILIMQYIFLWVYTRFDKDIKTLLKVINYIDRIKTDFLSFEGGATPKNLSWLKKKLI